MGLGLEIGVELRKRTATGLAPVAARQPAQWQWQTPRIGEFTCRTTSPQEHAWTRGGAFGGTTDNPRATQTRAAARSRENREMNMTLTTTREVGLPSTRKFRP